MEHQYDLSKSVIADDLDDLQGHYSYCKPF